MRLKDVRVGFAVTGSHCTLDEVMVQVENLVREGAVVYPIVSAVVDSTDTKYGPAQ
ncbi:MAG: hypothetical protein ACPLRU_09175 [Desulfofundulus sp.]